MKNTLYITLLILILCPFNILKAQERDSKEEFYFLSESDSLIQGAMVSSYLREYLSDYSGAVEELKKVEYYPDYFLYLRLGYLYSYLYDYHSSLLYYKKADSLENNSIEAKAAMMNIYLIQGDFKKCRNIALKINRLYPFYKEAIIIDAKLDMLNFDYATAVMKLKKYLTYWPLDIDANINLTYCYISMKKKQRAKDVLLKLKNLYPGYASISMLESMITQ